MSIELIGLTKRFSQQVAVNQVSFSLLPGQICGFLGPNGAGKSTTMKLIMGYLFHDSGKILYKGEEITSDNISAFRGKVGYLPENNPIYPDLFIQEYLEYCLSVKTNQSPDKKKVLKIMDRTGLLPEKNKKIGQLSKGYKQRVGLAQALIHEPEILILDEPTTGLDPNQVLEIRSLIKEIGSEKSVILSTHIMQEVEALCSKVVIIHKGKIVADSAIHDLQRAITGEMNIRLEVRGMLTEQEIKLLSGVNSVKRIGEGIFQISASPNKDPRSALLKLIADKEIELLGIRMEFDSLEDVFKNLTS